LLAATALALAGAAQAQAPDPAQSRIALPLPDGSAITAHWLPRDGERRPAVVALHGCGGLFRRDGKRFDDRYPDYVARSARRRT
jgi:predicted alpha/beta-fold hydrolase